MFSIEASKYLKRFMLLAVGIFILIHCLSVLLYVHSKPYKGFYVYEDCRVAVVDSGSSASRVSKSTAKDDNTPVPPIEEGDLILSIDGHEIHSSLDVIDVTKDLFKNPKIPGQTLTRRTLGTDPGPVPVAFQKAGGKRWTKEIEVTQTFPLGLFLWLLCSVVIIGTSYVFHYRRTEDWPTTLFYLMCAIFCGTFMDAFSWNVILGNTPQIVTFIIFAGLLAPVTLHFFLIYPQTSPLLRRSWGLGLLIYVPSLVYFFLMAVAMWCMTQHPQPEAIPGLLGIAKQAFYYQLGVTVFYAAASIAALYYCQRTTLHTDVKNQIKWIWWGVAIAIIPLIMLMVLLSEGVPRNIFGRLQFWAMLAMLAVLAASGLSLLKYRLMYVDTILNRSVGYVVVSAFMMVIYFIAVGIASLLLSQVTGNIGQVPFLVSVLAIALFFRPVNDWVQNEVDRRFYRERYELQQAVYDTSQAIVRILDLDLLLRQLMDTVMDSLQIKRGAVLLWDQEARKVQVAVARGYIEPDTQLSLDWQDPLFVQLLRRREPITTRELHERSWNTGEYEEIISRMVRMHAEVAIPIIREDEVLGILVLGRKRSRQIFSSGDVRLLMTLANHAAIAIHNARTYQRMEALNLKLQSNLSKIEEQRREILGLQTQLLSENVYLKEEIEEKYNFQDIVGTSPALVSVLETVKKVAASASAVLVRGESGTGKELVARAIHYNSARRDKPFIRMNCAVFTESLLESELFGHEKGAFTGAVADRPGRFEIADGGTIFLDEIGDISPHTQVRLLRVLQEKEFERVGSNLTRKVDVRVIAATNRDLELLMKQNRFREDLFYRLNVISIFMPPLRERREDLFPLAVHFLNKYARSVGKPVTGVDPEVLELFKSYRWPGNVRELENLIERAVVLADRPTLSVGDFPIELRSGGAVSSAAPVSRAMGGLPDGGPDSDSGASSGVLTEQLDSIERESLRSALRDAGGNKSHAAKRLGLARSTFISKLKKYGIE